MGTSIIETYLPEIWCAVNSYPLFVKKLTGGFKFRGGSTINEQQLTVI